MRHLPDFDAKIVQRNGRYAILELGESYVVVEETIDGVRIVSSSHSLQDMRKALCDIEKQKGGAKHLQGE